MKTSGAKPAVKCFYRVSKNYQSPFSSLSALSTLIHLQSLLEVRWLCLYPLSLTHLIVLVLQRRRPHFPRSLVPFTLFSTSVVKR